MKTFRWTVPEPSLSQAEQNAHRHYARLKGVTPKVQENHIYLKGRTPIERYALYVANNSLRTGKWSDISAICYMAFLCFSILSTDSIESSFKFLCVVLAVGFTLLSLSISALAKLLYETLDAKNENDIAK